MKVLVTGGTGFVGTHLVNRLLHRGHAVAVLARDPGKTRNRYNRPVEAVRGDVLDTASLSSALAGRDAVAHLVGIIHESGPQTFDPHASRSRGKRRRRRAGDRTCAGCFT